MTDDCFLLLLLAFIYHVRLSDESEDDYHDGFRRKRERKRDGDFLRARARVDICCCFFEMNSTTRKRRTRDETPMKKKNKLDFYALVNPVAEGVHQVRPKGGDATE